MQTPTSLLSNSTGRCERRLSSSDFAMSEINPGAAGRNIFGRKPGRAAITWFHAARGSRTNTCLYCTRYVGEGSPIPSDKEHLIGRRMPPPGGFSDPAAFNFMFRACCECNAEKAALEDHVSAVTLLTSPGRGEDPKVDEVARRKGEKSFDPRHGRKPVGEIRNNVEVKMGGVFTFNFVSAASSIPTRWVCSPSGISRACSRSPPAPILAVATVCGFCRRSISASGPATPIGTGAILSWSRSAGGPPRSPTSCRSPRRVATFVAPSGGRSQTVPPGSGRWSGTGACGWSVGSATPRRRHRYFRSCPRSSGATLDSRAAPAPVIAWRRPWPRTKTAFSTSKPRRRLKASSTRVDPGDGRGGARSASSLPHGQHHPINEDTGRIGRLQDRRHVVPLDPFGGEACRRRQGDHAVFDAMEPDAVEPAPPRPLADQAGAIRRRCPATGGPRFPART